MIRPRTPSFRFVALAGPVLLAGVGCGGGEPAATLDQSPEALAPATTADTRPDVVPTTLRPEYLASAAVQLPLGESPVRVQLRDGGYQSQSPLLIVSLLGDVWKPGDWDGDGEPEVATVVTARQSFAGGPNAAGPLQFLVIFGTVGNGVRQEAIVELPRDSRLASIEKRGVFIDVEIFELAPGDRLCCPTRRRVRSYQMTPGAGLVER